MTGKAEKEFLVRESRTVNFVFGGLLLLVCVVSIFFGGVGWDNFLLPFAMLVVALLLFARGKANKTSIRINQQGVFYHEKLVTGWDTFYDVTLCEKPVIARINDQFYLLIRYQKKGSSDLFGRKIPMSNTQDKADEEIIAAIRRFYQQWERQQLR